MSFCFANILKVFAALFSFFILCTRLTQWSQVATPVYSLGLLWRFQTSTWSSCQWCPSVLALFDEFGDSIIQPRLS